MKKLFASMTVAMSLVGCGGGEAAVSTGALVLDESSAQAVSGTYAAERGQLSFQAHLGDAGIVLEVRDASGELVASHLEENGQAFAFDFAGVPLAAVSGGDDAATPIIELVGSARWAAFQGLVEALEDVLPHDESPRSVLRQAFTDARVTAETVADATDGEAGYSCWCMQWTTHCFEDPGCMASSHGSCGTVCVSDCTSLWCD